MMEISYETIKNVIMAFSMLFFIINPISNVMLFVGMAQGLSAKKRVHIVNRAMGIASILLFVFLFFGNMIFKLFGIQIASFMVGGGLILLAIAVLYVLDIHTRAHADVEDDLAAVPMATPFLVGPGCITTTILLVNSMGMWITLAGALMALVSTWIILRFSNQFYRLIGVHWANILSRVMGLFVAAIAIEFIAEGIKGLIGIV